VKLSEFQRLSESNGGSQLDKSDVNNDLAGKDSNENRLSLPQYVPETFRAAPWIFR
jgi:hypothetical protein